MNTLFVISAAFSDGIDDYFSQLSPSRLPGHPLALILSLFCLGALLQKLTIRHIRLSPR